MYLRAEKKRGREVSLFEPIGTDKEGNMISLVDIIESNEADILDILATKRDVEKLGGLFDRVLREKEKQVVYLRYGLFGNREYTQREIAGIMGISRSYVSRIEKSAMGKLKAAMENCPG